MRVNIRPAVFHGCQEPALPKHGGGLVAYTYNVGHSPISGSSHRVLRLSINRRAKRSPLGHRQFSCSFGSRMQTDADHLVLYSHYLHVDLRHYVRKIDVKSIRHYFTVERSGHTKDTRNPPTS
ncbi:hypothetical protein PM082_017281 [Marasmius tenuissimus]|nr:hypothetical protein PM082_017281 [Marasmius tenuissimus]